MPTVVAVLAGQPLPLFQGAYPRDQVRAVIDQVLAAAEANGDHGPRAGAPDDVEPRRRAGARAALPPLHQAAYDAIERDDLDAATAAYEQALRENPRDALARAGLAQVELLDRTRDVDLRAARDRGAGRPDDVDAQLAVADVDVLGGQVEDAFGRLVDLLRATCRATTGSVSACASSTCSRSSARDDPRVVAARRAMANALY